MLLPRVYLFTRRCISFLVSSHALDTDGSLHMVKDVGVSCPEEKIVHRPSNWSFPMRSTDSFHRSRSTMSSLAFVNVQEGHQWIGSERWLRTLSSRTC